MENTKKGLFITFEGIDGCGKTTQIELLKNYLLELNKKVTVTLEPGGSDIGKQLRQILLHYDGFVDETCELLLFLADRSQHVKTVVSDNIEKGINVICDRFIDSTVAYQGFARNQNIEQINYLNNIAIKDNVPDITFLLDIDPAISQKRIGTNKDRLEKESIDFHNKVRYGYLEIAKQNPKRIKVIDATLSIEEIFLEIKKTINEIL